MPYHYTFIDHRAGGRKMRKNDCQIIAVYGTLKKGYWNHDYIAPLIKKGKARFIGKGKVYGYLLGGSIIPFAKRTNEPNDWIEVEVYEICDKVGIKRIDALEAGYRKVKVNVALDDGNSIDACLYDGSHIIDDAWANRYEQLRQDSSPYKELDKSQKRNKFEIGS